MTKAALRRKVLAQRKTLTAEDVRQRSQLIAGRFFDFLNHSSLANTPVRIHSFLPIQRQNEVDTWLIIRKIWEEYTHLTIAVPVTDASENTLSHYRLLPETLLVENRWGIPEPATPVQQPQQPADFALVLVPLLTFDQQGQRLGYGGGFYDRFLAKCRPDCLKIGLSLVEPVGRIDGIERTDVRLNACLTPDQTWLFSI